jgi:hypothetical protein
VAPRTATTREGEVEVVGAEDDDVAARSENSMVFFVASFSSFLFLFLLLLKVM